MSRRHSAILSSHAETEKESDYPRLSPPRPSPRRGREVEGCGLPPPNPHEGLHSDIVRSSPEGIGAEGDYVELAETEVSQTTIQLI